MKLVMSKTNIYNLEGKVISSASLPSAIFGQPVVHDLIYQIVVAYQANKRQSVANTKTRGEVSGSGKKPWRQKGTGRARAGDIRPPHWVGGGVAHGPRSTVVWRKKISKKMRQKAILIALSEKYRENRFIVVDKLKLKNHKTKTAVAFLEKLPIDEGSILILLAKNEPFIQLAFGNLPFGKVTTVGSLNAYDILKHDWLIADLEACKKIGEIFVKQSKDEEILLPAKPRQSSSTKKNGAPNVVASVSKNKKKRVKASE